MSTTPTTSTTPGASDGGSVLVATGSYTSTDRRPGPGVTLWRIDPANGAMQEISTLEIEDPSFVLWSEDGRLLHVVQETSPTRVSTLRLADDSSGFELIGSLDLTGSGGCHIAHGRVAGTLLVAEYGSGHVEVVRTDADGRPVEIVDVCDHGAYRPAREAHPHQSVLLPGTELIGVADLGLDRVYLYRQDRHGAIDLAGEITAPRFSGPRHITADHESRTVYLACELTGELGDVTRLAASDDEPGPSFGACRTVPASGREGENNPSHIEISRGENHLLLANRGPDTLAVHSLGMMRPALVAEIEVGAHPRHFARVGKLVLVAALEGGRIDIVRWDGAELAEFAEPVPAPSVTCIAPRP